MPVALSTTSTPVAHAMDEKTISSEEKAYAVPIELPPDPDEGLSPEEKAQVVGFPAKLQNLGPHQILRQKLSQQQEKKLLRRLDWALIPWVSLTGLRFGLPWPSCPCLALLDNVQARGNQRQERLAPATFLNHLHKWPFLPSNIDLLSSLLHLDARAPLK